MRRGDIYEYVIGSQRLRVVIVSADSYNPNRATFAVILGHASAGPPVAVAVDTAPADPVDGVIDLSRLRVLDPTATRARLGRLSATTTNHISTALRTYLAL